MEMILTRSSKKIFLTAGVALLIFYLMYRGNLEGALNLHQCQQSDKPTNTVSEQHLTNK
jgi:hypothetical protein